MKIIRKTLCIILVALTISGLFCPLAFAAKDFGHLPQIYVAGLGSKPVYYKNDPDKTSLFYPVDTDRLIANIPNLKNHLLDSVKSLDPNIVYNCVYSYLWDCFGMTALNPDGLTYSDELTTGPDKLSYVGNGKYDFNYDSRLGPVDLAHKLHEYIGWVQEDSGSEKVEIVGSSMGTAIVMAYLQMYPESMKYIDSVLLCVPSVMGVDFISELFTGKFDVDPDTFQSFINMLAANEDLNLLLSVLNKSGILDMFIALGLEPFMRAALYDALMDILKDVFATMPATWSTVQPKEFYPALRKMFGWNYWSPKHEYAVLIDKVIYYHENVMKKTDEIFRACEENGIKINIVCKYGRPTVPLSKDGNVMSDGLVELEKSSFGATCAMFGEALPKYYRQPLHKQYNFISPDRSLDASTGALPFNTWYIKGLEHGTKNKDYYSLLDAIIYEDLDIFSDPDYPQFLEVSSENKNKLVPTKAIEAPKKTSLITDVINLTFRLVNIVANAIKDNI